MKELRIKPRLGSGNIVLLERALGQELPKPFKDFMIGNAGLNHFECIYTDLNGNSWEVAYYADSSTLSRLTKFYKKNGWGVKVPFALDPGGWNFCLSLDDNSSGKILVNRLTEDNPEEQFVVIADSFEEFINGLHEPSELNN